MSLSTYLQEASKLINQSANTLDNNCTENAIAVISEALARNDPLLICGNGGSAADAMHITGELVGRFLKERKGLNCICLSSNPALLTAWSNDYSFDTVFSRQVEAYGRAGGIVLGMSTSGNSTNMIEAFKQAQAMNMKTIGLTGQGGGKMAQVSDFLIAVPSMRTPEIQQVHLCIYHYICAEVEKKLIN